MITTTNLSKHYGKLHALKNMTMTVNQGDIYGFIGPNGAGKSTTFKILATILLPDSGTATVDGVPITKGDSVRGLIGYMPDSFGVYEDMTVVQYLSFFAAAYYIPAKKRKQLIDDILELTDLTFKADAMVRSLSRGMQQRLGIARVLVHDPKVLILDEPASGLDPRARIELRELLKELAHMGKTILISSHILSELSEICTRVGIVEQGELVFEGTRDELHQTLYGRGKVTLQTAEEDQERALKILQDAPYCDEIESVNGKIIFSTSETCTELGDIPLHLAQHNIRIRLFKPEELSLEQAFMHLTQGNVQ